MAYIVIVNCKQPESAEIFTLYDDVTNDVYFDLESAQSLAEQLNECNGEGYARIVTL